jgi:hypothetical protein
VTVPTWNYRVVRKKESNGTRTYGIYEVYYSKNGKPEFCSSCPITPTGDNVRELKTSVIQMLKAFDKPVLKYEDF